MYKVTIHELTGGTEKSVWIYETIEDAAKFIHDLHHNYKTFLKLEQGKDYTVELAEV